ncbi:hypothetical protein CFIMG_001575RA [Ceratocystis fimbriata CBS 114723]|uniref:Transmembrane protein n=1 Tax=Ceratocystis fimbriata CBS 114723 TaxID=1035309 RepID=A0A2C5X4M6_9PEZI|nr:hypothetical protein CFIMG_001575RA [Ceratocystis fimbriata CBS 114723]
MRPTILCSMLQRSPQVSRATARAAREAAVAADAIEKAAERATARAKVIDLIERYPAKKEWPPDFKQLTPQLQFRLEKKWKRRAQLASSSPAQTKRLKLLQYFAITFVIFYVFFFGELELWGQKYRFTSELNQKFGTFFGTLGPEKRYERRRDVLDPLPRDDPK